MKAYTDLPQSKKLAEILPLESADMWFANGLIVAKTSKEPNDIKGVFPCWSLAALLEAIPKCIDDYNIFRMDINDIDTSMWYDKIGYGVCNELPDITIKEPVDACVAMIEKLHEQNIL